MLRKITFDVIALQGARFKGQLTRCDHSHSNAPHSTGEIMLLIRVKAHRQADSHIKTDINPSSEQCTLRKKKKKEKCVSLLLTVELFDTLW